ncbi:MAG TPA: glycosyltransferase family 39 protein [Thermoanaerobaculia bacterium]|nr:glycosyltransferase family 39 protein [Thermoanaerobaculia bacterium]
MNELPIADRNPPFARDRWRRAAVAVFVLGLGMRLAAEYPVHKYPADGDALGTGLCIQSVLHGETPIFQHPGRVGSLECHLGAPLLLLAGASSRAALAAVPVLVGTLFLIFYYRWARLVLGRPLAVIALLWLALPGPAVLFWTYMPNSYGTLLLLCAGILWLGARVRPDDGPGAGLALGIAVGLGLWHSVLTLPCSVPAVAEAVVRRRPPPRWLAALFAGVAAGAVPLLAFHLRYRLPMFAGNFGAEPITGGAAFLDNLAYLLRVQLPELVASTDPEGGIIPAGRISIWLRWPVLAIHAAALLALVSLPLRRAGRPEGVRVRVLWPVAAGVLLATAAAYTLSSAGSLRGINVRYVLPLYLVVPVALALLLAWVGSRKRAAALVLAAIVLVFNLASYRWPHHPRRQHLRAQARSDAALVKELVGRDVAVLLGSHWTVLPIAFLSGERVMVVPCEQVIDREVYLRRLGPAPYRWAVAGGWEGAPALAAWLGRMRAPPEIERVGSYAVGFPARPLRRLEEVRRVLAECPVPAPGP